MTEEHAHTHNSERCIFCEATDSMKEFLRSRGPSEEARGHFRQARVEFLKGIRRLIDDRIDRVQQSGQGTRITVE